MNPEQTEAQDNHDERPCDDGVAGPKETHDSERPKAPLPRAFSAEYY